jgi:hypothetical protein
VKTGQLFANHTSDVIMVPKIYKVLKYQQKEYGCIKMGRRFGQKHHHRWQRALQKAPELEELHEALEKSQLHLWP